MSSIFLSKCNADLLLLPDRFRWMLRSTIATAKKALTPAYSTTPGRLKHNNNPNHPSILRRLNNKRSVWPSVCLSAGPLVAYVSWRLQPKMTHATWSADGKLCTYLWMLRTWSKTKELRCKDIKCGKFNLLIVVASYALVALVSNNSWRAYG